MNTNDRFWLFLLAGICPAFFGLAVLVGILFFSAESNTVDLVSAILNTCLGVFILGFVFNDWLTYRRSARKQQTSG